MAAGEKHQAVGFVGVHSEAGASREVANVCRMQLPPGGYKENCTHLTKSQTGVPNRFQLWGPLGKSQKQPTAESIIQDSTFLFAKCLLVLAKIDPHWPMDSEIKPKLTVNS